MLTRSKSPIQVLSRYQDFDKKIQELVKQRSIEVLSDSDDDSAQGNTMMKTGHNKEDSYDDIYKSLYSIVMSKPVEEEKPMFDKMKNFFGF